MDELLASSRPPEKEKSFRWTCSIVAPNHPS
jgi:hypothetical protein